MTIRLIVILLVLALAAPADARGSRGGGHSYRAPRSSGHSYRAPRASSGKSHGKRDVYPLTGHYDKKGRQEFRTRKR